MKKSNRLVQKVISTAVIRLRQSKITSSKICLFLLLFAFSSKAQEGPPLGSPSTVRVILPGHENPKTLNVNVFENRAFFEGDICLGHIDRLNDQPQNGVARDNGRWLNNTMPYTIAPGHHANDAILAAINHINANTNLRLIPRTTEADYVYFIPDGGGCWSYVGKIGGRQDISIDVGCGSLGTVAHEILHASGMYHEQSREDRDTYVTINFANITAGREGNFNRVIDGASDHGVYNYGSVMHYGTHAFSSNGMPTIVIKTPPAPVGTTIGQRTGLNAGDIATVNFLYPSTCTAPSTPSVSSITTSGASVSWAAVSGATAYYVEYKTAAAASWTVLANTASTSQNLTGLAPATAYNVRVYSVCAGGNSVASTTANFTTFCVPPSTPTVSSIATTSATVSWPAVSGATAYRVAYKLSTASSYTLVDVSTTSALLTGLTPNALYNVAVHNMCTPSTPSVASTQVNFTTLAAPCNAPATPSVSSITTSGASVSWAAVSGATAYYVEYKTAAAASWTVLANTASTSQNLTGLAPATAYNVRVYSVCAGGNSVASTAANFSTTGTLGCSDAYEPNNTFAQARTISANTILNGSVVSVGDDDYFTFTTTAAAPNILIDLGNLGVDFDMALYNAAQSLLTTSIRASNLRDMMFYNTPTAGTYYIRVYGYNGATYSDCYRLTVITDAAPQSCTVR